MKEPLISFEAAQLAKEKGFDWGASVNDFYASNGKLCDKVFDFDDWCFAPTQALLQKWLRETAKIHITVMNFNFGYRFDIVQRGLHDQWNPVDVDVEAEFDTYEETLEAGLMEGLKLI